MMRFPTKRKLLLGIEGISFTDIIMNLFLFFFITFSLVYRAGVEKSPGIKVNLPRAKAGEFAKEKADLTITITEAGQVFFRGEATPPDEVGERFKKVAELDTSTLIIIQADKGVTHGKVVEIIDLAKSAGFTKFAIATQTKK